MKTGNLLLKYAKEAGSNLFTFYLEDAINLPDILCSHLWQIFLSVLIPISSAQMPF